MSALERRRRLPFADRRQQILDASSRLFIERGYEAVTMGDIASALAISRPTVYSYFTSTEAILDALLDERLHNLLARLEPLLAGAWPPPAGTPGVVETLFRFLVEERATLALLHSGGGPTFQARRRAFLDHLGARTRFGAAPEPVRHPHVLMIITTLLDSLAFRAATDPAVDPDVLARTLGAFVRGGVLELQRTAPESGSPA